MPYTFTLNKLVRVTLDAGVTLRLVHRGVAAGPEQISN